MRSKDNVKQLPASFRIAVDPAIKWLCENSNPHAYILVTPAGAELLHSEQMMRTERHILDDKQAIPGDDDAK